MKTNFKCKRCGVFEINLLIAHKNNIGNIKSSEVNI